MIKSLLNIIINSYEASTGDARIEIETKKTLKDNSVQYAQICITDHGKGIPDYIKEKIFEPFFSTKANHIGKGLGLAAAYGIIHEHNGIIFCESELGISTKFILLLPLE